MWFEAYPLLFYDDGCILETYFSQFSRILRRVRLFVETHFFCQLLQTWGKSPKSKQKICICSVPNSHWPSSPFKHSECRLSCTRSCWKIRERKKIRQIEKKAIAWVEDYRACRRFAPTRCNSTPNGLLTMSSLFLIYVKEAIFISYRLESEEF